MAVNPLTLVKVLFVLVKQWKSEEKKPFNKTIDKQTLSDREKEWEKNKEIPQVVIVLIMWNCLW